jgi:hypothetical protein
VLSIVPEDMKIVSTEPLGLVLTDGSVRWQVSSLGPGAMARFQLVARLPDEALVGAFYRNRVEATSREIESYEPDNSDEVWTEIIPGEPAQVTIRPSKGALMACKGDRTTLTATVVDRHGNPVADGTRVVWRTTMGALSNSESTTSSGRALVELTAGRVAGLAIVRAEAESAEGSTVISIGPAEPSSVAVSAQPSIIPRGGRVAVTANVLDACSNAVADGWPITMLAERGRFVGALGSETQVLTREGAAYAFLDVGKESGPLKVVASHRGVFGETVISVEERWIYTLHIPYAGVDTKARP